MDPRPIGIFDSGLGGLTAAKALRRLLPGEDLVYFGDTGRVPYGTRGREVITRYARQDAAFLLRRGVKAMVCACGTVSSVAGESLAQAVPCPFFMVVDPAVDAAVRATRNGRIGVIGTGATIKSGKFQEAIRRRMPGAQVTAAACTLFVPLVESGHVAPEDPLTTLAAEEYLAPLAQAGVDTLILGCTHYPIIAPIIHRYFDGRVTLIDSGQTAAQEVAKTLRERGMLSGREAGGSCAYYLTDDPEGFSQVAGIFLGETVRDRAVQVEIGDLEDLPV